RGASPGVGVGRREDDAVRVGPVVVQALPDALRAFFHVGLGGSLRVDLEVVVGAVAEDLRATGAEVGEPGDELLWRERRRLVEVKRGHACSFRTMLPQSPSITRLTVSGRLACPSRGRARGRPRPTSP